jgi:hypothetical protein
MSPIADPSAPRPQSFKRARRMACAVLLAGMAIGLGGHGWASDGAAHAAPAADPLFGQPYVDQDEWRSTPVRHRYVHGGFKGTDMRFSFYFPPAAQYQGRFFQYVTPVPDNENLAQQPGNDQIGFAIASGAYFVETNGGGTTATAGPGLHADPAIGAYRANAAAAQFSRKVATEMYGGARPYGYLYGGSGGGYRTLGSMENTNGVWDGAVPFVLGSPMAAPNVFSVRMHAMRILWDKFPQIVDAMEPGGSGAPYAGLNPEQRAALKEVTAMGFPLESWFGWKTMGVHAFTALYQGMEMADPTYFTDFWTKPGYLGFDHPESFAHARLQFPTTVTALLDEQQASARGLSALGIPGSARGTADQAWRTAVNGGGARPVAVALADAPPDVNFLGGDLVILSGAAKGKRLALLGLTGNLASFGMVDIATLAALKPGDAVQVDNSNFLAAQTYHRHQVPDASYAVWDQFRRPDGTPIYPQRSINLGPLFAMGAAGTVPTGKFNGRIIVVESLLDREAFPWQADWYARKFRQFGEDDRFRLWYTDHALHGADENKEDPTRIVTYEPVLQQALRDLAAWVEKGTPPPASTAYTVTDGQVYLPPTAAQRKGVQPVVTLRVAGGNRITIHPGQTVRFAGTIAVPPGTGTVVGAQWDFDGSGRFAQNTPVAPGQASVRVVITHRFDKPGTYFPALLGFSQRHGDPHTPYARIPNLGRVRVVVE